jgi:ABC-type antimicrobial peptide transport system permease subunit
VLLVSQRGNDERRANLVVRGVTPNAFEMIGRLEIVEGRLFEPGTDEAVVARRIQERFPAFGLGETVYAGSHRWEIVGVFEAPDSPFDSELWVDLTRAQAQSGREGYVSIVRIEGQDEAGLAGIQEEIAGDRRLALEAKSEPAYYAEQLVTASPIQVLAYLVALLMAIGAAFGSMNTMYGHVSTRVRELSTLRALGFSGSEVFVAVLAEAVLFSAVGAALGCGLAYLTISTLMSGGTGTQNLLTFAELAVDFRVSTDLALQGLLLGLGVGVGGGFLPAVRAARVRVSDGLREG